MHPGLRPAQIRPTPIRYIHPGGLVYWGKEIPTGMVGYIIRYLEGEGYEPEDVTDFPVTITAQDQSIILHREA